MGYEAKLDQSGNRINDPSTIDIELTSESDDWDEGDVGEAFRATPVDELEKKLRCAAARSNT
jgi:hypothetical protein